MATLTVTSRGQVTFLKDIAAALEALLDTGNVVVNRSAVDAGLAVFKAGGDFADGLIAYEGSWLGGDTFVSFDKRAVSLIGKQGQEARGEDFEPVIEEFINQTPRVLEAVSARLPTGFPTAVSEPIFNGLLAQIKHLE